MKVSKKLIEGINTNIEAENKEEERNDLEKEKKILEGFGLSPRKTKKLKEEQDKTGSQNNSKKSNLQVKMNVNLRNSANNGNDKKRPKSSLHLKNNDEIKSINNEGLNANNIKAQNTHQNPNEIYPIGIKDLNNITKSGFNSPNREPLNKFPAPKLENLNEGKVNNNEPSDDKRNTLYEIMQNQKQKEDDNTQQEYRNYMKLIGQPVSENITENTINTMNILNTMNTATTANENEKKEKKHKKKHKKKKKWDENEEIDDFQTGTAFRAKNEIIDLSKIYNRILSTKKVNKKKK